MLKKCISFCFLHVLLTLLCQHLLSSNLLKLKVQIKKGLHNHTNFSDLQETPSQTYQHYQHYRKSCPWKCSQFR